MVACVFNVIIRGFCLLFVNINQVVSPRMKFQKLRLSSAQNLRRGVLRVKYFGGFLKDTRRGVPSCPLAFSLGGDRGQNSESQFLVFFFKNVYHQRHSRFSCAHIFHFFIISTPVAPSIERTALQGGYCPI